MHHEAVVMKIFGDLQRILETKDLEVEAEFEERSGVRATVRVCGLCGLQSGL